VLSLFYFFRNLSLNVLINMVLTHKKACIPQRADKKRQTKIVMGTGLFSTIRAITISGKIISVITLSGRDP
jgi:hypothetical protein